MYVDLDREFSPISCQDVKSDELELRTGLGLRNGDKWPDLLKQHRVVILSAAGSGKTVEIQNICRVLRGDDKPAFFLRLEHLASDWETAFELGTSSEFESARSNQSECWVFLDSVDEARLSGPKDFELAIRHVASKLRGNTKNSHVFLTGRVSAWRPDIDLQFITEKLPSEESPREEAETGAMGLDHADGRVAIDGKAPKFYALGDLTDRQIAKYASAKGVSDYEALVAEIDRCDARSLAGRPQDLDDIIEFWKDESRLGSRLELVQASCKRNLKERDPDRAERDPLTPEKALSGAKRLAAAVSLTRRTRIVIPGKRPYGDDCVRVADVLTDWNESECAALLGRPIYEPETYGYVRFHHREVLEYLAAQWFLGLLTVGNSRRAVEALFFVDQYGIEVLVPKLRPLLPWLALSDERVRDRIVSGSPEVLFEGGDPSQLPAPTRMTLLTHVCERYASEETGSLSVDLASVQRLSRPDMAGTVRSLFERFGQLAEIQNLLLRMIELGRLDSCFDLAESYALNEELDVHSRMAAIRAVAANGSQPQIDGVASILFSQDSIRDRRLLSDAITAFGSRSVSADDLLEVLPRVARVGEYEGSGLTRSVGAYLSGCRIMEVERLLVGIHVCLKIPPLVERRQLELSEEYSWMLGLATEACERLVVERHPSALGKSALSTMSLASISGHYHGRNEQARLRTLVRQWPELNLALFWFDVEDARRALHADHGERLKDWWRMRAFRDYWAFTPEDFDTVLQQSNERSFIDDRLVALSLAFHLYVEASRPRRWRDQLKRSVAADIELKTRLHELFHPPAQRAMWKRQDAGFKRRQKKMATRRAENDAAWKATLPRQLDRLRDCSMIRDGKVWTAQSYLLDRMRELDPSHNRWAQGNWRDLEGDQSPAVAEAFRDGLLCYWHGYCPVLASEAGATSGQVSGLLILGLSGLQIEASETESWPNRLSVAEAEQAGHYLFHELNGFPDWFKELYDGFPDTVSGLVVAEIGWDLFKNKTTGVPNYVLSDIAPHVDWLSREISEDVYGLLQQDDPTHVSNLVCAVSIVLADPALSDERVGRLAEDRIGATSRTEVKTVWYAAWMSARPADALPHIDNYLSGLGADEAVEFTVRFLNHLYSDARVRGVSSRAKHKETGWLLALYLLMLQYIRVEDDIDRPAGRVYSPTARDEAQTARSRIFAELKNIPGKKTFLALWEIAERHPDSEAKIWIRQAARERAELDADARVWRPDEFVDFASNCERTPVDHRQLYDLVVGRLEDVRTDLEDGDASVASLVRRISVETELRNYFGHWLREHARGRYDVPQEEELADAKRPDIRVHCSSFDAPVPIELKIADNWGGPSLFERLQNQLCGDYLRDSRSHSGVFMLTYGGDKSWWQHPEDGRRLSFGELVDELQRFASGLIQRLEVVENIRVIGIDLTRRTRAKPLSERQKPN